MSGVPAYDRGTYLEDIRTLRGRGYTVDQICSELGISRATYFRIVKG
jgi:orotate phosphoribosyltransferase-like protein